MWVYVCVFETEMKGESLSGPEWDECIWNKYNFITRVSKYHVLAGNSQIWYKPKRNVSFNKTNVPLAFLCMCVCDMCVPVFIWKRKGDSDSVPVKKRNVLKV